MSIDKRKFQYASAYPGDAGTTEIFDFLVVLYAKQVRASRGKHPSELLRTNLAFISTGMLYYIHYPEG